MPDFVEEKLSDGSIIRRRATRWRNVAHHPVTLELRQDEPRWSKSGAAFERPKPALVVTIQPGHEQLIPSEFDHAIQQTICHHPSCAARRLFCRDETHTQREIVGGLAPHSLRRVTEGGAPAPVLHPSLAAAAPLPRFSGGTADSDADARLLERARRAARTV